MMLLTLIALAQPWLLVPGTFHGDEVAAKGGERVWALRQGALEEATLVVEAVKDELVDEEGQQTGRRVSLSTGGPPVLIVAGVKLEAGAVTTLVDAARALSAGKPVALAQGERRWVVEGFGDENGYRLVLTDGTTTQTLATHDSLDDAMPQLLWAGDLDRDGKPDLLIDVSRHYNVSQPTLFLSKEAKDGELVKLVAAFQRFGC